MCCLTTVYGLTIYLYLATAVEGNSKPTTTNLHQPDGETFQLLCCNKQREANEFDCNSSNHHQNTRIHST
jgi:hypothetical protein